MIFLKLARPGCRTIAGHAVEGFCPARGSLVDFTGDLFADALGSKYSFQSHRFTFNSHKSLNEKQVLAYNLYGCGTGGSPPFYGNCICGANNALRGYTAGRYLDRSRSTEQQRRVISLAIGE